LKNRTRNSTYEIPHSLSIKQNDYFSKADSQYLNAPIISGNATVGQSIRPEESYIHQLAPTYHPNQNFGKTYYTRGEETSEKKKQQQYSPT
jgi:hypothetical protein